MNESNLNSVFLFSDFANEKGHLADLFSARWPSILTREAFLGRARNDWAEEHDDCGKPIHITERRWVCGLR